jgi:hypothetical protein
MNEHRQGNTGEEKNRNGEQFRKRAWLNTDK